MSLHQGNLDVPDQAVRVTTGVATLSPASGDLIAVQDPQAGPLDPVWTVTLSITTGTLALPDTAGVAGSGNGTELLSYSGSLTALNAALAGLTLTMPAGYQGNTTLSIEAQSDGAAPVQAQVPIIVTIGQFEVTSTADSGPGSLRQAILDSNATTGGKNTIDFDIAGAGSSTIELLSPLPTITNSVAIDGSSEPGYAGAPLIAIVDPAAAGSPSLAISAQT